MSKTKHSDTDEARKATRPVLIASRRTIAEHRTFLQRLLVGLADESITTALVCPPDCDLGRMAPVPTDIFTHPPIDLPLMEHVGIESLVSQLERFRPTVLHCLCESRAALVRHLAQRLNVPYVLAINTLVKRASRRSISLTHCTHIIVPARTIVASAAKAHFRCADRIRQVNPGTFAADEPVCFSDPLHLSSILVAHPLQHAGHFEGLFKAIRGLLADGHEFMVVIMGSGRAEGTLRKRLAEYGLAEVVTIVPPLNPLRSVLASADIFVQPQPIAAFSAVVLEALGLGMAVVACAGEVDDLIVPNQTALVIEPNDEASIRENLARLLSDHDFARGLAQRAQSYVADRYSVGAMVAETLEIYGESQRQYNGSTHQGASNGSRQAAKASF